MAFEFTNPQYLWFFLSIPFLIIVHFVSLRSSSQKAIEFANFEALAKIRRRMEKEQPLLSIFQYKNLVPLAVRVTSLTCLVLAVSGLIYSYSGEAPNFDFVLAIDISSSMLSEDLQPNRLEAAKEAAGAFQKLVSPASIGLVTFSGTSFIELDMTDSEAEVGNAIQRIAIRNIGGTDLGGAIITSVNLLSQAKNAKAVILLTDGQSNIGVGPNDAISYASQKDVVVHTIGVGTLEGGFFRDLNVTTKLDEETLKEIAEQTGGLYFRGQDIPELNTAFSQIADFTRKTITLPLAPALLLIAILLWVFDWLLISTRFRIIP
ncbi:MAG TPA: VWA domain-containing protein [Candidatus Nanoarchaeia archaeon]|nr:VWA domain-containing protein [Candidatus Nanoarchaeia archaeon]